MALRIGYKASSEQFAPGELAGYAIRAEELGFDSAFIADHFQPWRHSGGHAPASVPWLAHVAARTERIVLGTSVMTPTFRYNPAVIAQEFATLACLAPGRIVLGVGTGEALNEVAVGSFEGDWPDFKERFARLREAVALIRELWAHDPASDGGVNHDGDYYRTSDATVYDLPEQPVPLYIAAGGPMVARYAGRYGDGFICTSGKGRELYADQLIPAVATGLEAKGRAADDIDRMIEIKISYDRDHAAALENTRFWAPLSLTPEQKHSVHSSQEMERLADELPIEQVARRWIVASTPDEALAAIGEYVDLGFTHLVVHGPGHDQERFLSQFAADVLPGLRALG